MDPQRHRYHRMASCVTEQPADSYDVDVTAEGDQFLAEVRGIPGGTCADSLKQLEQHAREVIILGADLADDATPALRFHYRYPEPGHPPTPLDEVLFESPQELVCAMDAHGLTVDEVRQARASGLI